VLLGALALLAGCGADEQRLTLPPGQTFVATATLGPTTSAFGDPLHASVRVLLDRNHVDPGSIKVLARFSPFRERTTVERVDSGNLTALTYRYTLHCLTLSCVPQDGDGNTLRSDYWEARITSADGPVLSIRFPDARMVARVEQEEFVPENAADVERWPPRWRAAVSLPEPGYAVSPSRLALGLGLLGLALVAGSAAGAFLLLRRGRLFREAEVPALQRALELLRTARTEEERRAALEALALALEEEREDGLSEPARALAWSPAAPGEEDAAELASLAQGGAAR
jgi:hypothetical protein